MTCTILDRDGAGRPVAAGFAWSRLGMGVKWQGWEVAI